MKEQTRNRGKEESGSVAVIAALGLAAFFGLAALALDVGHLVSMKNELKRAADAGALAGARGLWPKTLPAPINTQPDCTAAQSSALSVSTNSLNKVDQAGLAGSNVTIQTGRWDYPSKTFTPGNGPNTNAVQVITQATASMSFAQVFGAGPLNLSATSTAIMDFANSLGKIPLPIAINKQYVQAGQVLFINFTSTCDDGGWFTVPPDSANASTYRGYIDNLSIPTVYTGDIINLQNGQDSTVLQDINSHLTQYNGNWDTFLPVVNTNTFNGSQAIIGFVPFRVTKADSTGTNKGVTGTVLGLDESANAQPGGTNFGLLAPPKLIL